MCQFTDENRNVYESDTREELLTIEVCRVFLKSYIIKNSMDLNKIFVVISDDRK